MNLKGSNKWHKTLVASFLALVKKGKRKSRLNQVTSHIQIMKVQIKRVYEKPGAEDGFRILVDRLWPRGLTKEKASVDLWLKEIAPATELRKWFDHDPSKWKEFQNKYRKQLDENKEAVLLLKDRARSGNITLPYAAKDVEHNEAQVIKDFIS